LASGVETKGRKTNGHKQGLCVYEMARVMLYCRMAVCWSVKRTGKWPIMLNAGLCVFTWWSTAGNLAE